MIPRDYQRAAVDAARERTGVDGNTMLVLPTGAGKTAVAGFYIGEEVEDTRDARVLVLQHTDELIEQNRRAIAKVTGLGTSIVKAEQDDWVGPVVFGSVQTLGRPNRRERMASVSHLVIDECHRAAAASYQSIIEHVRGLNPRVKLLGLSATPGRGDGRSLRKTFTNIGYQLKIGTLIARGLLVPPRTFTIDLGVEDELAGLHSTAGDLDMREADKVLNRAVLNDAVVEHWKERAADRRSIFFCATVDHAEAVAEAFRAEGVTAETVTGEMPERARADLIARFDRGQIQVLTNCMVLTEGFDSQPVGCIGILRPMLHKGTFIQAIGRGLRRIDPERFPGIVKTDCSVLDFAGAALRHGSLEQEICLDDEGHKPGVAPWKTCPSCEAELPLGASICDFCGHGFARERGEEGVLTAFEMTEIDLLDRSPFAWCDLHGDGQALMASGFQAGPACSSTARSGMPSGSLASARCALWQSAPACRPLPPPTTSCARWKPPLPRPRAGAGSTIPPPCGRSSSSSAPVMRRRGRLRPLEIRRQLPPQLPLEPGGDHGRGSEGHTASRRMNRPNPLSPERMSARERLGEICELLALGLIRLRMRDAGQVSAPVGESCLHFALDQSGYAEPKRRRTA